MALTPHIGSATSAAAALADELLAVTRAELPALAELPERERLLVAVWLVSLRSARTRRAYFGDLAAWLAWLCERHLDPLIIGQAQVNMWVRTHCATSRELTGCRTIAFWTPASPLGGSHGEPESSLRDHPSGRVSPAGSVVSSLPRAASSCF